MSQEVHRRIRAAIDADGPITFARFMDEALYGPGGYYEQHPVGRDRGFVTAPHVHPVFADLLRFALLELRDGLGRPDPLRLVELGAGDGTLAAQLLAGLRDVDGIAIDYTGVDISPGARRDLAGRGLAAAAQLEDLAPGEPACAVANELLDNLPMRWLRAEGGTLLEVRVGWDGERFVPVPAACDPVLAALAPPLADGEHAFVSPAARDLIGRIARWLRRGYVLLIDYGWADRPASEVHGYRQQREVADVLADPGAVDITAAVDFGALRRWATEAGLVVLGEIEQSTALQALGFGRWEDEQRRRQAEADAAGASIDALRIWEGRGLASMLVDPARMGSFRWLLLATPGLLAPAWLTDARTRDPRPDEG